MTLSSSYEERVRQVATIGDGVFIHLASHDDSYRAPLGDDAIQTVTWHTGNASRTTTERQVEGDGWSKFSATVTTVRLLRLRPVRGPGPRVGA